jgi:acetoin utilization deacetylase AcuC-like enzyme
VRPDFIVVSAGYDFAAGDPVGDLGVDARIAARSLAMLIRSVAAEYARGRVAYVLEGGYDIDTLALAVAETVRVHDAPADGLDLADATAIPARQRAIVDAVDAWVR